MSTLQNKLEEQKKIIEFLSSKYEKDTGRKINLPTTLGQLLGDDSIIGDDKKADANAGEAKSFGEAVEYLKLPRGEPPKKGERRKKEINMQPHHMIEKIDLSGFRYKRFSRSALKELVEGLALLPCIRTVCLRDNGITDDCEREIVEIFNIQKIKCIDLSNNNLQKLGGIIGKKLKDECTHIQWIDLTQNEFYNDNIGNNFIIQGLKKQTKLIYAGLTVQGSLSEQMAKLLMPRRPAMNLNMRNSSLSKSCTDYLFKAIELPEFYLTSLSLKFCYLNFEQIIQLSNSLRFNKTIVKLDLSQNGLKSCVVKFLLDSLLNNVCLSDLDLSSNFLDDEFAKTLAIILLENPILFKVDISRNPIGPIGAEAILQALTENETLGSLGGDLDSESIGGYLDQNVYMGVRIREKLRQALQLNNSSHDKKRRHMKEIQEQTKKNNMIEREGDDPTVKLSQKKVYDIPPSQQAKYPLLKPVTFTNIQEDDYLSLGVWSLK